MRHPIPHTHVGKVFLLSQDGRDSEWVNPASVPERCAGWTDVTDLSLVDLDTAAAMRMQQNPTWGA